MKKALPLLFIFLFVIIAFAQESDKKSNKNIPDGYSNLKWGTSLSNSKKGIKGKLLFTDDKKVIISKDGELKYKYGFFYNDSDEAGRLFYVSLSFPYLSLDEVKRKIEEKYGQPNSENLKNNQGAMAWDSDNTIIIMWIDNYEDKPYCRRIVYIGKKIAKEMNEYQNKVFNKIEIEIIKKLSS